MKLESLHPLAEIIPPELPTVQFVSFNVEQVATSLNSFLKVLRPVPLVFQLELHQV
jgi:hypothetical protein